MREGGRVIDDPVVVVAPDYSWADISVHGGTWVVSSVLELARKNGFTIFDDPTPPAPEIAFDEAATEIEREMLAHLPLAKTELAIQSLLSQPAAWESAEWDKLVIAKILADRSLWHLLHPPASRLGRRAQRRQIHARQSSLLWAGTIHHRRHSRNDLSDWAGEIANIEGLAVLLVDTPGQRQTADAIEHAAI